MDFPEVRILEEKIEALLSLVERLKREKASLEERLRESEAENLRLKEAVQKLETERQQVRERIHQIVAKIERLEAQPTQGEL